MRYHWLMRCVIHGSFQRHLDEIRRAHQLLTAAGVEVIAPSLTEVAGITDGFVLFEGQESEDPRLIELRYLQHLRNLGVDGFSLFVIPEGYVGKSASYELGIAQLTNVPTFFTAKPKDHPVYAPANSIWEAEALAEYIASRGALPEAFAAPQEKLLHDLWEQLMVPGSVVAVGGIIEYTGRRGQKPEVLLVRTHKWGDRWSMVGGKVRRNERLVDALLREVREETGLEVKQGQHVCTFDQLKNSGYYVPGVQHVFVDYVAEARDRCVKLNEEAEERLWMPVGEALDSLDIEPNARHTLEQYAMMTS